MEGSAPREVGRPSRMMPYAPQVAGWLREDPGLSGAEILRRIRRTGYRGGKTALYELVRQLRVPGSGYRRCPRCRALLRDIAQSCRHCGHSFPSTSLHPSVPDAEALEAIRQEKEAATHHDAAAVPAVGRYLVIAAPDRQELYEYFKRKFDLITTIEVVRERRLAERRTRANGSPLDRRRRDRRARPAVEAELRAFGFAIVRRD